MKRHSILKLLILLILFLGIPGFFIFDLHHYFTLEILKSRLQDITAYYQENRLWTMALYLMIYVGVTALSLPGAAVMTLAGGALFGLLPGTLLASFGSTIGATLAFLFSRYIFRDLVQKKLGHKLAAFNKGIEKEGGFYLFTLRLVPVFPFFIINLVMGLTSIRTLVFFWVSQIGMLPGTLVYVNAGKALAGIESLDQIFSARLVLSFALLGIFPFIARKIISVYRTRKIMSPFKKPARFDYNLVVIGAGSAGLVASYIAAAVKAKVALIEADKMGGDCLNTGCVPSKALLRSANVASLIKRAETFGLENATATVNFPAVMERIQSIIKKIEPHDSVERYTDLGVDCISGHATIVTPYEIKVNDRRITTRSIIIATGAHPMIPSLPGLDQILYYTSDTLWEIRNLPEKLVVIGGGPIGCELAQAFSRLGSRVTLVQRGPVLMNKEDPEASQLVREQFESEGIRVLTHHAALRIEQTGQAKVLVCDHQGREVPVEFTDILVALGRVPNIKGFGAEALGIRLTGRGTIETNEFLQTNFPNIFCSGDVTGTYQFTHTASHESWYACVNALFGSLKSFRADYGTIPWATYTDPEVARVGLNETQARKMNVDHEVTRFNIEALDRAITDSEARGFIKVITARGSDRILGVTIVGHHAGDIIAEYVLAMKHHLGLNKILGTIHIYPTMAEANKSAAGMWKKNHAPEKLLRIVEKFHTWKRK